MGGECDRGLRPPSSALRPLIRLRAPRNRLPGRGRRPDLPNWHRISDALARQGVTVAPSALAAAEPHARLALDDHKVVGATTMPAVAGCSSI